MSFVTIDIFYYSCVSTNEGSPWIRAFIVRHAQGYKMIVKMSDVLLSSWCGCLAGCIQKSERWLSDSV